MKRDAGDELEGFLAPGRPRMNAPLELDVLVTRFEQEMGGAIGDPARIRSNFLVLVERLFPTEVARVERRLHRRATPKPRRTKTRS